MANAHHTKEKYALIAKKLKGQKRTPETIQRMVEARKGYKHSPETLAKLRGRKNSLASRKKMSEAMKGRIPWNKGKTGIYSEEYRKKISLANIGKKIPFEQKMKQRESIIKYFKSQNPSYIPPEYFTGENDRKHENIRKLRLKNNGGHHTKQQWEFLKGAYNYTCRMCNKIEPEIKLTKDHIVPIRHGGNDDIQNIQPLCRSCNSKKH